MKCMTVLWKEKPGSRQKRNEIKQDVELLKKLSDFPGLRARLDERRGRIAAHMQTTSIQNVGGIRLRYGLNDLFCIYVLAALEEPGMG